MEIIDLFHKSFPPFIRNCYKFVKRLPDQEKTILSQGATNISQGQRQLLSIARAACADAPVMILDEATSSQAETIYATIIKESIKGSFFIKDADCSFGAEIFPHNGIVVYPLEKLSMVNPQHKSYVAVDDMLYITNTIEKRVIDHYFNAGGYCFEDAETFMDVLAPWKYAGIYAACVVILICAIVILRAIPVKDQKMGNCDKVEPMSI